MAVRNHSLAPHSALNQDGAARLLSPQRSGAVLLFFAFMAVLHSWPLASDPTHLGRLDSDDASLNTWVIAWVAHILPRDPLHLFEAPIFFPEPHTLAYSEHLFVPALMGAPLWWLGASPVLEHNLLLIAGLALSGWAMALVISRWTGSLPAGLIAGLIYAFNAHVLTRLSHLQAQHVEFFPLMLYAFDRVLVEGTRRGAVLLAGAFVLQALCSDYLLVFAAFALVAAALVRGPEWWRPQGARARTALLVAAAISVAAVGPFLWPYYEVSRDQGLVRSVSDVARYSAGWRDYLTTGGRLHYALWSHNFFEHHTALFPGLTALALAGIAIGNGDAWRNRRARMALAFGAVGIVLSFGPTLPEYAWLHEHVPPLGGLRNAARWGWLWLAAVALLAGFGAARLRPAMTAVIGLLVTIESLRTPVGYTRFDGLPRIYDRVAAEHDVVLAEFPFHFGAMVHLNGPYVLANTRYFRPLVNGYSGFQTATYEARGRDLNTFPSSRALAELKALGVTHVTVHRNQFRRRNGEASLAAIDTVEELVPIAEADGIRLYRFSRSTR